MSFETATRLEGGPGEWRGELVEGWDIFGVTNGGYLMSIATRAMESESESRTLISATGSFLNPATPGPVEVSVERLKVGRSLSTLRALISRDGRDFVHVTGVFAASDRPRNEAIIMVSGPPDLPPPEECFAAQPVEGVPIPPPFAGKVDMRVPPEDAERLARMEGGAPRSRGWFRLRDDEPMSAHTVVLASDAFAPSVFFSDLSIGWTPTVDLTVQVRNPSPKGWLACQYSTRFISEGLLEEDGEIWDQSGNLVGLSRQLALVSR